MKKALKIIAWIIGVVLFLIIALTVVAKLSENKIADIATEQVTETINAPVEIGNVSFNLLRKFPYATIELNGIYLGVPADSLKSDSLTYIGDSIMHFGKIYLSVKTKPLIDGIIEVVKVEIEDASINYLVNSDSITNIDFLIPASDTTSIEEVEDTVPSAPLNASLQEFTIRNLKCYYNDSTMQTVATVLIPEITMSGGVHGDTINGKAAGSIEVFGVSYPETNAHLMKRTQLAFDVEYKSDGTADSVKINNVALNTDGASLGVKGEAVMSDEIYTDLNVNIKDLNLGELIKYAPAEMLKEFGVQKVTGNISMNADIKGVYSDSTQEMPRVDATVNMKNGLVQTADYPTLKALSFNGKVTNGILKNNSTTQADFSSIHFETNNSKFDIAFSVLDIDHPKYDVKTDVSINVGDFAAFIPDSTVESVQGIINASFSTNGVLPDPIPDDFVDYALERTKVDVGLKNFNVVVDPSLSVKNFNVHMRYRPGSFKVSNLGIQIPEYGAKLKNTSFDIKLLGKASDPDNMAIDLRKFNIQTDSSKITGNLYFQNGDTIDYKVNTSLNINLGEFYPMVPDSTLDKLAGKFDCTLKSAGSINPDTISDADINNIIFKQSSLFVNFRGIDAHVFEDPLSQIDDFSGKISFSPKQFTIRKMTGKAAGIDFRIDSTSVRNIYETIVEESRDTQIVVETVIELGTIDANKLMALMEVDSTEMDTATQIASDSETNEEVVAADTVSTDTTALLPDFVAMGVPHFLVRGRFAVDKIIYEKNIIDDISANFRLADSLYVVDQFKLTTCGGVVNTSLKMDARKDYKNPMVDIKNYIDGLDLNELLVNNNNFDQTDMTHENLSGILSSEFHARALFVDGDVPTDKIKAKGHFTLEDGKIHDFEPLVQASVGIGGLKELDKMDFNTLKTSIFLWKDKVYVPKTDVVSNALDLSAFAMHGMNEDLGYEYHLVLHLGDVLTGKNDKLMAEQAKANKKDGGNVERKGLNLVSMDRDGQTKNGFDNDKLKKKFANELNKQEGFLNLLFNPLLVNYSTELDRSARDKEILEKYGKKE